MKGISGESATFPGYLCADYLESPPKGDPPTIAVSVLLRFASRVDLQNWETSSERAEWLAKAREQKILQGHTPCIKVQRDGVPIELDANLLQAFAPPARPSPPPKWRLSLLIYFCVTTCVWAWVTSGATPAMMASGVASEIAVIPSLLVVVGVIVYAYSEVLQELPLGPLSIGRWLKSPHTTISAGHGGGLLGCLRTSAAGVCECCVHGSALFNPPPPPPPPAKLMRRLSRVEGRLEALKRHQHHLLRAAYGDDGMREMEAKALRRMESIPTLELVSLELNRSDQRERRAERRAAAPAQHDVDVDPAEAELRSEAAVRSRVREQTLTVLSTLEQERSSLTTAPHARDAHLGRLSEPSSTVNEPSSTVNEPSCTVNEPSCTVNALPITSATRQPSHTRCYPPMTSDSTVSGAIALVERARSSSVEGVSAPTAATTEIAVGATSDADAVTRAAADEAASEAIEAASSSMGRSAASATAGAGLGHEPLTNLGHEPLTSLGHEPLTIIVHHNVRWDCWERYAEWLVSIHAEMGRFPGFLSLRHVRPQEALDDEVERRDEHGLSVVMSVAHTVVFRFRSLPELHTWMASKEREDLLVRLAPLLYAPDKLSAASSRVLPDAFTDLFVAHNQTAPLRPPPKWKVVLLTSASLWCIVYPVGERVPPLLASWGVNNIYAQVSLTSFINVWANAYAIQPLLTRLVGAHWLSLPRPPTADNEPWRTLDQGFRWRTSKVLLVLLYFALTTTPWSALSPGRPAPLSYALDVTWRPQLPTGTHLISAVGVAHHGAHGAPWNRPLTSVVYVSQRGNTSLPPLLALNATDGTMLFGFGEAHVGRRDGARATWGAHGVVVETCSYACVPGAAYHSSVRLYVQDLIAHTLVGFGGDGTHLFTVGTPGRAGNGTMPILQFGSVSDAVVRSGTVLAGGEVLPSIVFASDGDGGDANRVVRLCVHPSNTGVLFEWATGPIFHNPHSITLHAPSGLLLVADRDNAQLRMLRAANGADLGAWDQCGLHLGQNGVPFAVRTLVTHTGRDLLFVATYVYPNTDGRWQRIVVLDTAGLDAAKGIDSPCTVLQTLAIDPAVYSGPHLLGVDPYTGDLYAALVADVPQSTVLRFRCSGCR